MLCQIPNEIFMNVKQEVSKHIPSADLDKLEYAYHYAAQKHASCSPRMTGEAYICHPLRVGLTLAKVGMSTDIVIAAFLHDVLEDCDVTLEELTEEFGDSIASIVNSVTALRKEATANLTKEERDNQSYKKFLQNLPLAYHAIYVKLADRLDNLQTMDNMPDERMLNKLQETEDFYLPLANALHIHLFMSEIKDLLCQLRNPISAHAVQERYEHLLSSNADAIKKTKRHFETCLYELKNEELACFQKQVVRFFFQKRYLFSLSTLLEDQDITLRSDQDKKQLNKYNLPLYDIYLILNDSDEASPLDGFFLLYKIYLLPHKILFHGIHQNHDRSQSYLLLSDETDVYYRLFLHTANSYRYYLYGIDSKHDETRNAALFDIIHYFDTVDPKKTYAPKITVLTKDNKPKTIEAGSSVLDFAFAIHPEVGLRTSHAIINGKKTFNLSTRLHHGDQVIVELVPEDEPIPANLEWFRWLNTSRARMDLYKWLNNGVIQIHILDVNRNQYFNRPSNSSVLDHLLLLNDSLEKTIYTICHVSEISINKHSYSVTEGLRTVLHHKDRVQFQLSDQITYTPSISCFVYLNCREAREKMLQILEHI